MTYEYCMGRNHTAMDPDRSPLIVEIVEALNDQGMASASYQLHDYVDPDALEQVVASVSGDFTVAFTVETMRVVVTPDGVEATPVDHFPEE